MRDEQHVVEMLDMLDMLDMLEHDRKRQRLTVAVLIEAVEIDQRGRAGPNR
jgi:hypothetical protein